MNHKTLKAIKTTVRVIAICMLVFAVIVCMGALTGWIYLCINRHMLCPISPASTIGLVILIGGFRFKIRGLK